MAYLHLVKTPEGPKSFFYTWQLVCTQWLTGRRGSLSFASPSLSLFQAQRWAVSVHFTEELVRSKLTTYSDTLLMWPLKDHENWSFYNLIDLMIYFTFRVWWWVKVSLYCRLLAVRLFLFKSVHLWSQPAPLKTTTRMGFAARGHGLRVKYKLCKENWQSNCYVNRDL